MATAFACSDAGPQLFPWLSAQRAEGVKALRAAREARGSELAVEDVGLSFAGWDMAVLDAAVAELQLLRDDICPLAVLQRVKRAQELLVQGVHELAERRAAKAAPISSDDLLPMTMLMVCGASAGAGAAWAEMLHSYSAPIFPSCSPPLIS